MALGKSKSADRPFCNRRDPGRQDRIHPDQRLAPGTGIGRTADFVKMVKAKGIKPNAIGVEVISDAILAKGLEYAANHTYENTKKVLEEAWPEVLQ